VIGSSLILHPSSFILLFAVPLGVSAVLTVLLIRWAPRLGLVDHPDPRKVHRQPTPRAGGLAIAAGVAAGVGLLSFLEPASPLLDPRWTFGLAVVVLGLLDDLRPLPWQLRLGVQTAVAVLAFASVPTPDDAVPAWLTRALAVAWTVGLVNAFNMLDNMDLLSGGVAWVASGCLAAAALFGGPAPGPSVVLMGALAGFLWFNRPPARIFMGDAGSTFLGFFLAVGTVQLVLAPGPPWRWAVPPCLLAVPCYDLVAVVLLRLRQGRSPFHADRQHLSHRLVAAGLSPPAAVRTIHLLALASGAGGLLLYQVGEAEGAVLVGVQFALWWAVVVVADRRIVRRWFTGAETH
jgi:UDP-GlcNAc:undecaprenyl-phosphate GlcNAc-1-phosphate transferase